MGASGLEGPLDLARDPKLLLLARGRLGLDADTLGVTPLETHRVDESEKQRGEEERERDQHRDAPRGCEYALPDGRLDDGGRRDRPQHRRQGVAAYLDDQRRSPFGAGRPDDSRKDEGAVDQDRERDHVAEEQRDDVEGPEGLQPLAEEHREEEGERQRQDGLARDKSENAPQGDPRLLLHASRAFSKNMAPGMGLAR